MSTFHVSPDSHLLVHVAAAAVLYLHIGAGTVSLVAGAAAAFVMFILLGTKTVFYVCQNQPANEVVANFFDTDPATIRLERGDLTKTLWRVGPASAGAYEGQNISLVHQGSELKLSGLDTNPNKTSELQCKAR